MTPIGPNHHQRVDLFRGPQSKMQARIDGRLEPPGGKLLEQLDLTAWAALAALPDDDFRSDARRVRSGALEYDLQIMVPGERPRAVSIARGAAVDLRHDQEHRPTDDHV